MHGKLYRILTSIATMVIGMVIMVNSKFYDPWFDYTFDFSGLGWIIGFPFFIIGLGSIVYYAKQNPEKYEDKFLKCLSCYRVYNEKEIDNNRCKNCQSEMEPLKGFFERHPDLKEHKSE